MNQPLVSNMDEVELARQYSAYKAQFEDWKEKNRNHPDRTAYNQYIEQWEKWEKQVEQRRSQIRQMKQQHGGLMPGVPPGQTTPMQFELQQHQNGSSFRSPPSMKSGEPRTPGSDLMASSSGAPPTDVNNMMSSFMNMMNNMNPMFMNPMMSMMMNPLMPPPAFPAANAAEVPNMMPANFMEAFAQMMGMAQGLSASTSETQSSDSKKELRKKEKKKKHKREKEETGGREEKKRKKKRESSRSSSRSRKRSRSRSRSRTRSPAPRARKRSPRNWDKILDIEKHLDEDLKERLRMKRNELDFLNDSLPPHMRKQQTVPATNIGFDAHRSQPLPVTSSLPLAPPRQPVVDFTKPPPGIVPISQIPRGGLSPDPGAAIRRSFPPTAAPPSLPPAVVAGFPPVSAGQVNRQQQFVAALSQAAAALARNQPLPQPLSSQQHPPVKVDPSSFQQQQANRGFAGFTEGRIHPQPRRIAPPVGPPVRDVAPRHLGQPMRRMMAPGNYMRPPMQHSRPPNKMSMRAGGFPGEQRRPNAPPQPLLGIDLGPKQPRRYFGEPAWMKNGPGQEGSGGGRRHMRSDAGNDDDEGLCSDQD